MAVLLSCRTCRTCRVELVRIALADGGAAVLCLDCNVTTLEPPPRRSRRRLRGLTPAARARRVFSRRAQRG